MWGVRGDGKVSNKAPQINLSDLKLEEDKFVDLLIKGSAQLGLVLDRETAGQLRYFAKRLVWWNERVNLTALVEPAELLVKHLLDSLSLARLNLTAEPMRVADIGTGGGLPGIPLSIVFSSWEVVLIEARRKKVGCVRQMIRELELSRVSAIQGRAEEVGRKEGFRGSFALNLARAVAPLATLLEYALPLLEPGGMFVAYKGPKVKEEIADMEAACRVLGGQLIERDSFTLPFSSLKRELLLFTKTGETPRQYPRRPGMPEQSPIEKEDEN